jgi:hypothetical protein
MYFQTADTIQIHGGLEGRSNSTLDPDVLACQYAAPGIGAADVRGPRIARGSPDRARNSPNLGVPEQPFAVDMRGRLVSPDGTGYGA